MAIEREAERERSHDEPTDTLYPKFLRYFEERKRNAEEGAIVIKGKDVPWVNSQQGYLRHYTSPIVKDEEILRTQPAIEDWQFFCQDVRVHSGKHIHQGGLGLHVLEGRGYTVMNGERVDWEEGDLILLPVLPGGVEHQHFNNTDEGRCIWLAAIFWPFLHALGNETLQVENRAGYVEADL